MSVLNNPTLTASLSRQELEKLLGTKDFEKAERFGMRYIQAHPRDGEIMLGLARSCIGQGKQHEGLTWAERALSTEPTNLNFELFLAQLYVDVNLQEYAWKHLQNLLTKARDSFPVQWAAADYFMTIGQGHKAVQYFENAMQLCDDPNLKCQIKQELADCLRNTNSGEAARILLLELLTVPAMRLGALYSLCQTARKVDVLELLPLVDAALCTSDLAIENRVSLLLSKGRLLELQDQTDRAFAAWSESRNLSLSVAKHPAIKWAGQLQRLQRVLNPLVFKAAESFGHNSEMPILIGGMARSGTTLTEQIIAAHPECVGIGELGRMGLMSSAYLGNYSEPNFIARLLSNARSGELSAMGNEVVEYLKVMAGRNFKHVVDKTPTNWTAFGYGHLIFPKAKFIHCARHPADSFISSFQNLNGEDHSYVYTQERYAELYLEKEKTIDYWKSCFPKSIFTIHYEELVRNPEESVRRLLGFLGLPWNDKCMRFFENESTVRTYSTAQVRQSFYTSSVGRWRRYGSHLHPLLSALDAENYEYPVTLS
jgi:tetratricopeptide (TPR) repeat protein